MTGRRRSSDRKQWGQRGQPPGPGRPHQRIDLSPGGSAATSAVGMSQRGLRRENSSAFFHNIQHVLNCPNFSYEHYRGRCFIPPVFGDKVRGPPIAACGSE